MVEHGATPSFSVQEAQELGFKLIIFPFGAIGPAYYTIRDVFQKIKDTGTTGLDKDFTPKKLFEIVGLEQATAIDVAAGGIFYTAI
jgi:2-methylisocitrate lyase-like PEP mutase family enzyme